MELIFHDRKLKKNYESHDKLKRVYGDIQAKKIIQRLNELSSAENLYDISKLPQTRLHLLSGNFKNHYAVDLKHPFRMIILPIGGTQGDLKTIIKVQIVKIIDYH